MENPGISIFNRNSPLKIYPASAGFLLLPILQFLLDGILIDFLLSFIPLHAAEIINLKILSEFFFEA
jgi:hypothetical protein